MRNASWIVATLRHVRHRAGVTQVEVARRWRRSQSQVARLESVPIESVSMRTLRSYVEALGGRLVLAVELDGETHRVDME